MLVSICIPTYKRANLLLLALRSVVGQSYRPIEILIGDDSPTDEVRNLVEGYSVKGEGLELSYHWNRPPLGQARNVNSLVAKARGEALMILHDDDELLPGALDTLVHCWHQIPGISATFGKQILIEESGSELPAASSEQLNRDYYRNPEFSNGKLSPTESALVQQFPNDCALLDAALAKQTPLRDPDLVGDCCDFDFGIRFAAGARRFWYLDEYTAKYRITEGSIVKSMRYAKMFTLLEGLAVSPEQEWAREIALARHAPPAIREALKRGDRTEAWRIYLSPSYAGHRISPSGLKNLVRILTASQNPPTAAT